MNYDYINRFPSYGWIFPCSQCKQPTFQEGHIIFICNTCKIKNKDYRIRICEQVKMKQNDINQFKQQLNKPPLFQRLSGILSIPFNKISPELN